MKKILLALLLTLSLNCLAGESTTVISKNYEVETQIELINDSTLVYRQVDKIEIQQSPNNITYVIRLDDSKVVAAQRGSFSIDVNRGDYVIISQRPFTKVSTDVKESRY